MEPREVERLYGRAMAIDLCRACHLLWFDDLELLQLSPGATLDLFATLGAGQEPNRRPLPARLQCPRCPGRLAEATDQQRGTRFAYLTCPRGHGRLLTYYQFLRARNFVRSLGAREVASLRRTLRQVNCANCGAPLDLSRDSACRFCRTPLAVLDPSQVEKAVAELQAAERERQKVDPTLPIRLLAERAAVERHFAAIEGESGRGLTGGGDDLLAAGVRALARWMGR
jgi:hypothetical protein